MSCSVCPTKPTYNFQYINENCFCDLKKMDSIYSDFFGKGAVFLSERISKTIHDNISKIEHEIRKNSTTTGGILMSYDFHVHGNDLKLIEINTNAGGIFLNYKLQQLALPCCSAVTSQDISTFESAIVNMFENEFLNKSGRTLKLKTVAIMDEHIHEQFLFPEMRVCKEILEKKNIQTFIVDSNDVVIKDSVAYVDGTKIDLLYNRNTDFYFEKNENRKFLEVLQKNETVITPSPEDHSVFADKINLVSLCQKESLQNIIPRTILVDTHNQEMLFVERKNYFFKPRNGYGGRGSYNGKGITKKVWEHIINNQYVAQEIVTPNTKLVHVDGENTLFKFDIRAYCYNGRVLLLGARVYQGQTTNFRTKGGGFMPVFITKN